MSGALWAEVAPSGVLSSLHFVGPCDNHISSDAKLFVVCESSQVSKSELPHQISRLAMCRSFRSYNL